MMTLCLGSNNPNKLKIVEQKLTGLPVKLVMPVDLGISFEPQESGQTSIENARLKALAFHRATGLPCVAQDAGLVFLDLPRDHADQPGIHVKRPCGYELTDDEMIAWYSAIAHRHGGQLRAAWLDAWCLVIDEAHVYSFEAEPDTAWAFLLVEQPGKRRCPGWPLDAISRSLIDGAYKLDTDTSKPFFYQKDKRDGAHPWLRHALSEWLEETKNAETN